MPDRRPGPLDSALKTVNRLRRRGPGEVLSLAVQRLADAWSSEDRLSLMVRAAESSPSENPDLRFRAATAADAHAYAKRVGTDSPATFERRLAPDVTCFLVEGAEGILHASWVTTTWAWTREIRGPLSPPEGDCYVYESFTRADARGRGIYPFALEGMVTAAAERNLGRVWVGVEADNAPSKRAIDKAGFSEAFVLPYRRRLGRLELGEPYGPGRNAAPAFLRLR